MSTRLSRLNRAGFPLSALRWIAGSAFMLAWLLAAAVPAAAQQGDGRGRRSLLLRPCDEHWDHGRRAEARDCYRKLIQSVGDVSARAEAYWRLGNFQQANERFRAAVSSYPDDPDIRVRWGYLFLETQNEAEAAKLFSEALALNEDHAAAKLAKATLLSRRFEGESRKLAEQIVEEHPEIPEAYLLLARMELEEEDPDEADPYIDQALEQLREQDLAPLEAFALKASAELLRGNEANEWVAKALEYNPAYGKLYEEMAHFYVITRRYRESVALYRKAIAIDPQLWGAHAELGVNLLRLGEEEEAKRHLEIAYRGDPYSATTVNTLRLLDSFKNFETHTNAPDILESTPEEMEASLDKPKVILKLHEKEADVLRPYVMELAERCLQEFEEKYRFKLKEPVRIEMYPDHDDFAVRTVGMPGLGLLGVTFGHVVAMDSPSGRPEGTFHWGTTLWHELAHVFTLEMTNHLIPRWYSEGISMYEEWEARPSWGERVSIDFLRALEDGKLLPIADLDEGFIRPEYPNQIAVSYLQAGLVCRMIAEQWGFEKLLGLLDGYAGDRSTPDNFQQVLGISAEEFDERFKTYLDERYGEAARNFDDWRDLLKEALEAARDKKWEDVFEPAGEARDLFPEFVESGSPYVLLAEAYEKIGDERSAIAQLLFYRDGGGRNTGMLHKLADMLTEAGRRREAIETLDGLLYVTPGDVALHKVLGRLLFEQARFDEAAREYRAVLALDPLDTAGAHYDLARTYHRVEDRTKARRHVLMSLEAAPSFRPAQKLLLETVAAREQSE